MKQTVYNTSSQQPANCHSGPVPRNVPARRCSLHRQSLASLTAGLVAALLITQNIHATTGDQAAAYQADNRVSGNLQIHQRWPTSTVETWANSKAPAASESNSASGTLNQALQKTTTAYAGHTGVQAESPAAPAHSSTTAIALPKPGPHRNAAQGSASNGVSLARLGSALAAVAGLSLIVLPLLRKLMPNLASGQRRHSGPVELLHQVMVDRRCTMMLLRCGPRLMLLATTPTTVTKVAEFTDPQEIQTLLAELQQNGSQMKPAGNSDSSGSDMGMSHFDLAKQPMLGTQTD